MNKTTKHLKKGDLVKLMCGYWAEITEVVGAHFKVTVHGETTYNDDVLGYQIDSYCNIDGVWVNIEHTLAQKRLRKRVVKKETCDDCAYWHECKDRKEVCEKFSVDMEMYPAGYDKEEPS